MNPISRPTDPNSTSENMHCDQSRPSCSLSRGRRMARILAMALAGGTMFSSCETRVRDAVVGGSKNLLFSLLSPDNFALFLGLDLTDES